MSTTVFQLFLPHSTCIVSQLTI
uniref:Uncharacterized protein n=1 Tax=Arundo donax TaxID=35708 RepID=A0A0A9ATR2_ARUDO